MSAERCRRNFQPISPDAGTFLLTENRIDASELQPAPCVPRPEPQCDHGSATGLDMFDQTLQITNIWLDALPENIRVCGRPEQRPDPSSLPLDAASAAQLVHRFSSSSTREEKCHASQ
jgi:hypothetical protein